MIYFLYDKDTVYSYNTFLLDIQNTKCYFPYLKTNNLYLYFLNLVKAIIANKPIVLIDFDINDFEIDGLNDNTINVSSPITPIQVSSFEDILKSIHESTSEISIFTSGTTGQPKKVIHTFQTLTRSVRISEKYNNQRWGFAYNPTHMAGLQVFFQAFLNMNTLFNIFNQSRNLIYKTIEKYSITHISATPTFYRLLLPVEKSYYSVKRITFGGEKSDRKLHDMMLSIFPNAKINNIYASTEAGSLFFAQNENFLIPSAISNKIKVKNNELLIHKSLLGKSDSFTFSGDYYHSGDLIEWINEEEGLFRFKSRKNELINIGGYKVNPTEVESVILEMPEILQVVVFGKQNSILGNILCAEVIIKELNNLTELSIRNFLKEKLQDFKIPRRIIFVNTLSITRTGKLKRI